MTGNKRFTIEKKGGMFYIFDTGNLIPVSDGQPICDLLNELHEEAKDNEHYHSEVLRLYKAVSEENEQLKQAIAETEKMVQSTYDELTKLRCIKKNLGRIKSQWDWIMEAIQYD